MSTATNLRHLTPLDRLRLDRQSRFPELLLPGEIALLFRVQQKTVVRYADGKKFPEGSVIVTPGGHHRVYRWGVVQALLEVKGTTLTRAEAEELVDNAKALWIQQRETVKAQKEE